MAGRKRKFPFNYVVPYSMNWEEDNDDDGVDVARPSETRERRGDLRDEAQPDINESEDPIPPGHHEAHEDHGANSNRGPDDINPNLDHDELPTVEEEEVVVGPPRGNIGGTGSRGVKRRGEHLHGNDLPNVRQRRDIRDVAVPAGDARMANFRASDVQDQNLVPAGDDPEPDLEVPDNIHDDFVDHPENEEEIDINDDQHSKSST